MGYGKISFCSIEYIILCNHLFKVVIVGLDAPLDPRVRGMLPGGGGGAPLLLRPGGRGQHPRLPRVALLHCLLHEHPVPGVRVRVLREVRVSAAKKSESDVNLLVWHIGALEL